MKDVWNEVTLGAAVIMVLVRPRGRTEMSDGVSQGALVVPDELVWPRWWSQTNTSLAYGELELLVRPGWGSRPCARVVR
jgi:hypothetical protein